MFEDALLESSHRVRTSSKYWSMIAMLINCGALIALILWPLFHPQALSPQIMSSLLVAPAAPLPVQATPAVKVKLRSRSLADEIQLPNRIPTATRMVTDSAAMQPETSAMVGPMMDNGIHTGSLSSLMEGMNTTRNVVQAAPARRPNVSSGVMAGNLIEKIVPLYPAIARTAHIQGTVVLQATIGKGGSIENLRVISGHPMLQQAAMDAVRSWRYKPFLLNGEPVEVETTVNVVFNLGN